MYQEESSLLACGSGGCGRTINLRHDGHFVIKCVNQRSCRPQVTVSSLTELLTATPICRFQRPPSSLRGDRGRAPLPTGDRQQSRGGLTRRGHVHGVKPTANGRSRALPTRKYPPVGPSRTDCICPVATYGGRARMRSRADLSASKGGWRVRPR